MGVYDALQGSPVQIGLDGKAAIVMTYANGDVCDITGKPRHTTVRYGDVLLPRAVHAVIVHPPVCDGIRCACAGGQYIGRGPPQVDSI